MLSIHNLNCYAIAIIPLYANEISCLDTILDIAETFADVLFLALSMAVLALGLSEIGLKAPIAELVFCCHLVVTVLQSLVSGFCILYMCSGCAIWH